MIPRRPLILTERSRATSTAGHLKTELGDLYARSGIPTAGQPEYGFGRSGRLLVADEPAA